MAGLDQLEAAMNTAWGKANAAKEAALKAEAAWSRAWFLELAAQHPGITGVYCNSEYCSDDEGGMFLSITVHVDVDPDAPGEEEAYETHGDPDDQACDMGMSQGCAELLFGDDCEGSLTLEQLKALVLA